MIPDIKYQAISITLDALAFELIVEIRKKIMGSLTFRNTLNMGTVTRWVQCTNTLYIDGIHKSLKRRNIIMVLDNGKYKCRTDILAIWLDLVKQTHNGLSVVSFSPRSGTLTIEYSIRTKKLTVRYEVGYDAVSLSRPSDSPTY